ncbi:ATP synthase subunit I [Brevibacillus borstelensis]|uniref:ATP synthase subunit I n=1 Tax=Brevibacillus borstelensis TaxID=45462 RepID=UPI001D0A645E|nr:ATP synthase subunit I [Brevibacillus borstelensis]MCC0563019.1 ATP synthase subunit I [Brevibacillus borstelensis]
MQTFTSAMRATFRYAFFCVALVAILWAVLPPYRLFLQSLLLGMGCSLLGGTVLVNKTWRIGQMAVDPSVRPKGTGMLQRLLLAGFAVFLTIRFPHLFVLSGVLIGLFLFQVLGFFFVYRSLK